MDKNYKDIIEYLSSLQKDKEKQLENGDFSKVQSAAYGLGLEINAIKTVIDIIKEDSEEENSLWKIKDLNILRQKFTLIKQEKLF